MESFQMDGVIWGRVDVRGKGFLQSNVCQVTYEGKEAVICIGTNERVLR